MAENRIRLPDDTGNLGKYSRTQQNNISGFNVEQQVVTLAAPDGTLLNNQGTVPVSLAALTTAPAGLSAGQSRSVGATPVTVKASAGTLLGLQINNAQAAIAFVQVFNHATPTVGTTAPLLEVQVPANAQMNVALPLLGVAFGTAITLASTTAAGGNTGSAAGVHVFYQFA